MIAAAIANRFSFRTLPPGDYFAVALSSLDPSEIGDPELMKQLEDVAVRFTQDDAEAKTLDLTLTVR